MDLDRALGPGIGKVAKKALEVAGITKHRLPVPTPIRDVVEASGFVNSGWSRHATKLDGECDSVP